MEGFDTLVVEGLFYREEGGPLLSRSVDGKVSNVTEQLDRMKGRELQLAMHHLPDYPLAANRWGGGCCLWQATGNYCPAGHHENPSFLLSVSGRGVLRQTEDGWCLETFEGTHIGMPLNQMEGHMGRIAAVTIIDLEKMKDSMSSVDLEKVDTLGVQAKQLQDILSQLQELTKGIS